MNFEDFKDAARSIRIGDIIGGICILIMICITPWLIVLFGGAS